MNVYSIVVQVLVLVALIAYSIQCNRLGRQLRQERRDLFTATGLLWALADRTEPKTLYVPKEKLKPAKGGPTVTLDESANGWTITAGTHHAHQQQDES